MGMHRWEPGLSMFFSHYKATTAEVSLVVVQGGWMCVVVGERN
jgi:hypothetical protein